MILSVRLTLIFLLFQFTIFGQNATFELNHNWTFSQAGNPNWYKATVPGTVHTDLLMNKLIEDPFYRLNETGLQWIDKVSWEYHTTFELTAQMRNATKLILIFEGLDTYADVYLNDHLVLEADNMFLKWEIPLNLEMLKDKNELRVYFHSPIMKGLNKLEAFGMPLPADNDQSAIGGLGNNKISVFTRKAGYHYGWDWGPRLVTSGIWRNVYIHAIHEGAIDNIHIQQQEILKDKASLIASVQLKGASDKKALINLKVNGVNVKTQQVIMKDSLQAVDIPFQIAAPILWWPNGHGDPYLYDIDVELSVDNKIIEVKQVKTGLRILKLIRKPDKNGETFYFAVNEKPVFAKGANYIPNDVFLNRISPAKYDSIISAAAKANMNMLRVWGGGFYENDLFYDLCDKYGIMVWQDFMFACAMYPDDPDFYNSVKQEAVYNIQRLRNHACMALWCGNNEIEIAWAQYEENRGWGWKQRYNEQQRSIIWKAYDTIFHHILPEQVRLHSPAIDYWHSSPSAGYGKLASHTNTSGDMHYWGVWHGEEPIDNFKKYKARFMSEYGFQSFPEYESVKKYTNSDDWSISSEVMMAHQRSGIGNQRISDYMKQSYTVPQQFEDQLYIGQLLQAEAIKKAIQSHRSTMPYCMGSLYWQLNDCWPVASWSGIDYYGRWKALHYFAREAFKNRIITVDVEGENIIISGVSDVEAMSASLRVNLMDFKGKSLWNRSISVNMPANGSKVLQTISLDKIPALQNAKDALLYVTLVKNEQVIDADTYYFEEPKNLRLPHPDISFYIRQRNDKYEIEISTNFLCKNLMLVSEGNAYSFSDNFFDLLPGQKRVITAESTLSYDEFERRLSYIHLQQTTAW